MSFKPIDPKRDEIRRYLERGSVLDSLTKIFIRVIKERPENPMEYIRNNIGVVRHQHDKYERLLQGLQEATEEIQRLRAIINSINPELLQSQGAVNTCESDPEILPVTDEVENSLEQENTQISNESSSKENGVDNTKVTKVDEELTASLDNCHIEEKGAENLEDTAVDKAPENISVHAEGSQTDNTK